MARSAEADVASDATGGFPFLAGFCEFAEGEEQFVPGVGGGTIVAITMDTVGAISTRSARAAAGTG